MRIFRNILAVILGWAGGSAVNMSLIYAGHAVFPMEGVDPSDMEALAAAMPDMTAEYFIFPFLAHAVGTLVGAFLAALIAGSHKTTFAGVIGGLFFAGGLMVNFQIPGPLWFTILDMVVAYIPMAWLGGKIAITLFGQPAAATEADVLDGK